ncbi:Serine/threonine protein kinase PrkC, regulator of stationary phase [Labilithrix luteola]|uniref:Serine/threonine protein kinase PrkC, regulator of stationary phase n=1 Tax=Labilithrix luteola TaxID=1391654 RepID=A0A0K1QDQ5_9BACT|nr:serine/threonine-protein kinase [Labilithrix luteola]AKV03853.1 Serine/threonine protein kinase PrkC, regulator of stationary phase [Labilithrix luteola]
MASRPIAPGDIVAAKFRIDHLLGEGGMGVVFGAHHLTLNERVAIKVLRPEATSEPEAVARFLREARAAVRIKGEHVARVLDVGALDDGTPYMAMEYLEGADLATVVERQGRLPVAATIDYVMQASEALAEAHALGIVHRDVKPSNLFLTKRVDGTPCVKVLDFGISKVTNLAEGPEFSMTQTQAVLGSPQYMAPEQMRSSRRVDARTDIWSLGTIVHELLTGEPPFSAQTMTELCAMILQDPAPSLRARRSDVPHALDAIVARCLEKDPSRRPASVLELAQQLAPFGTGIAHAAAARIVGVDRHVGVSGPRLQSQASTPALASSSLTQGPAGGFWRSRRVTLVASVSAALVVAIGVISLSLTRLRGRTRVEPVPVTDVALGTPSATASATTLASATANAPALAEEVANAADAGLVAETPAPSGKAVVTKKPGVRPLATSSAASKASGAAPPPPTPPERPAPVPAATASSRYD